MQKVIGFDYENRPYILIKDSNSLVLFNTKTRDLKVIGDLKLPASVKNGFCQIRSKDDLLIYDLGYFKTVRTIAQYTLNNFFI